MLITVAPQAIPVSTANAPTESVATEAAQRPPIQEPAKSAENPGSRNTTENNEQPRNPAEVNRQQVNEREGRQQGEQSGEQQSQQQAQEQREIEQLVKIDREVRAHEQAHAAVGGNLAGSPSYTYTTGPNGQRYAVAGEVPIDISPVPGDPGATVEKMQQVRRAALAPADPSSQDQAVAANASQIANQARVELSIQNQREAEEQREARSAENSVENSNSAAGDNQTDFNRGAESLFTEARNARNASIALNDRIARSGALDQNTSGSLFSQSA